ncbi:MAG: FAD-binding oxidoreductase [Chloroflexota bacterium]
MKKKVSAEIVVCGAGIAGVATAYFLSVKYGINNIVLVDAQSPMTLTSDKSTECYRNWWPGPGSSMVQMMNRSIDLMDALAVETGNLFHLNRRGYLYVTLEKENIDSLSGFAEEASGLGAGEFRIYSPGEKGYQPSNSEGFENAVSGADLITNQDMIKEHFPYLSDDTVGVLHVRRAGWMSAQQFGMYLLEQAKVNGVTFVQDRVVDVITKGRSISGVKLASGDEINTSIFVNAAGPYLAEIGEMIGEVIPVSNELHLKMAFNDTEKIIDRDAPLVIFADEQQLEWGPDEYELLSKDDEMRWLTQTLPSGAHTRPEGGAGAESLLVLWDTQIKEVEPIFPPPTDEFYGEIAIRGLSNMIPGMQAYRERLPKMSVDGGYYTNTQENRPLASPLGVEGAYIIGAMSGYGIMAATGMGELTAMHITGADLPVYADDFLLTRYSDPNYQALLENWGNSWQL